MNNLFSWLWLWHHDAMRYHTMGILLFSFFFSLHCVSQFRLLVSHGNKMYANNNDKWLKQTNLLKHKKRRTNLHRKCKQIKSILKTAFMHANSIFQPKWYQMKYCVSQFLLAHLSLTKRMCIFGCYIKICSSSTLLHRPFAVFPLCSVPNWNEVILRYFRITYYAVHPDVYGAHLGNIYIATQLVDS